MTFLSVDWNINDTLINLGPIPIKYYSLMFVISFLVGLRLMKQIFNRENVNLEKLDTLFVYCVVSILVGARLGHVFFYDWDKFKGNLLEIIIPFDIESGTYTGITGLASHGALIGGIVAMILYRRKYPEISLSWILDRVVIPVSFGTICVRIGNLMNSEIIGKPTGTESGFRFIRNYYHPQIAMMKTKINDPEKAYDAITNNPKFTNLLDAVPPSHPAQLYESIGYVFVFLILYFVYWKTNKSQKPFYLFGLFLILLFSVRFIVEFYKVSQGGFETAIDVGLSTGQLLSIPFIIIGLALILKPMPKSNA